MTKLAEIVPLPPSERARREAAESDLQDAAVFAVVLLIGHVAWIIRRCFMQGDLARYDGKIRAKREADAAALATQHASDLKVLRDQIEADGMSDDDRAVLARMKTEAGE